MESRTCINFLFSILESIICDIIISFISFIAMLLEAFIFRNFYVDLVLGFPNFLIYLRYSFHILIFKYIHYNTIIRNFLKILFAIDDRVFVRASSPILIKIHDIFFPSIESLHKYKLS